MKDVKATGTITRMILATAFACVPALAVQAYDFDFTKTEGGYGPLSAFSAKPGVTATAFYAPDFKSALQEGWLGQFTELGLGVCNPETEEGKACGSREFRTDMKAEITDYQFILFRFSTPVDLRSITVAKYDNDRNLLDRNLTYYSGEAKEDFKFGSVAELEKMFSAPTSIECSEKCGESTEVSGKGVNFVLVGSSASEKGVSPGQFRIQNLTVTDTGSPAILADNVSATPEPGTWFLGLTSLALMAWVARRRGTGTGAEAHL